MAQHELLATRTGDGIAVLNAPSVVADPSSSTSAYAAVTRDLPSAASRPVAVTVSAPATSGKRAARSWQQRYIISVVLADVASAVAVSIVLAALLMQSSSREGLSLLEFAGLLAFPLVWISALGIGRCYEERFLLSGGEAFKRLFDTGLRLLAVAAVIACLVRGSEARMVALVGVPLALALGVLARAVGRGRLHAHRSRGGAMHRVVVVGSASAAAEMIALCQADKLSGFEFVGALVDSTSLPRISDVPVLGRPDQAGAVVAAVGADTLLVASGVDAERLTQLCWQIEGLGADIYVAPNLSGVSGPRLSVRPVGGVPLLHVDEPELSGPRRLLKAAFDRTVALCGLLALSPVLAVIAAAVVFDSRGPVIFKQTRVGRAGSQFTMWKFRSMVPDAEARRVEIEHLNDHGSDHVLFKIKDDPRITRVGRFLRRYSLDELPQLVNVLRGEMSLVGPRPPLPTEVERYADSSTRRLLVRPGLTGLWQVSGRSDLSWDESLRLDLHYVENWTLFFDLHILWKTGAAVIGRDGAY